MKLHRRQLLGITLTSMGCLALEVVLTRIFSVTLWYHFAFLAVSLSLMGSASAGVCVYFFPQLTQGERARRAIGWAALLLALSIPVTLFLYLQFPFEILLDTAQGIGGQQVFWLMLMLLNLAIPFFLSGLVISLNLTVFARQAGRIYWADLTGAALGCLVSILLLERFGGAGAVLAIAAILAVAGVVFSFEPLPRRGRFPMPVPAWRSLFVALPIFGLLLGNVRSDWLVINTQKGGGVEAERVYERWNAHSRVSVYETQNYPFFWSIGEAQWDTVIAQGGTFRHALLLIDAVAGTPIQGFDGALNQVEFLRYDLTSFVYHVVENPVTLVIGPGGGRDMLAALASGAPHVTGVEVNPAVIDAVRGPFAEFSGHLYERPDVTIVVADARGYIASSRGQYDVIQASLIDTWAAGGSGAFALSENSLYTREAFRTYYERLTDRGVMTVSRWYQPDRPAETLRLVSTALAGWAEAGVAQPAEHVAIVARLTSGAESEGLATALFKREPFTPAEVAGLQERAEGLGFTVLYAPGLDPFEEVGAFLTADDPRAFVAAYPLDISPATDDRPFFFNLVLLGDLFSLDLNQSFVYRVSLEAIYILGGVIGVTLLLSALLVLVPLTTTQHRFSLKRSSFPLLFYFALLGAAFMIVEIPTIQKLTVYLGRPVYSLAIVLFTILLFSSLGSLVSNRWQGEQLRRRIRLLFPLLALTIIIHALTSLWPLPQTLALPFAARLTITLVLLAPPSFLMGMPFPLAIRWVGQRDKAFIPWLFGINGVMSVCGSALATALSLHFGFRVTLVIAALLYLLAGLFFAREFDRSWAGLGG